MPEKFRKNKLNVRQTCSKVYKVLYVDNCAGEECLNPQPIDVNAREQWIKQT
jgi:hypothetical protein